MRLKPSSFDPNFFGCPKCDYPLDPTTGEWEDTGGVTCACGGFVPLPDPPQPEPIRNSQIIIVVGGETGDINQTG
jgi:hypothetical protein